jgi:ribA/ribD-fused uncharacterized protein
MTDIHDGKYTFFWGGPFSQWWVQPFEIDGKTFNCAEQWMMYNKAILFGDNEIAEKIMQTNDPKEQKALGREVNGFNETQWNTHARKIVIEGNKSKFSQHSDLMRKLFDTGNTLLVEASPSDKIWGIGLNAQTARQTPVKFWRGTNWLGESLTYVRECFRAEQLSK